MKAKLLFILVLLAVRLDLMAQTTNAVAAEASAPAAPAAEAVVANTNSLADTVQDAITFDASTTLPEAVRTLAKQAGINFQFDPKIINLVAADGKTPVPPPTVDIQWKNVTPMQALEALLDTYGWQMIPNPKTKIARITVKDTAAPEPLVSKVIQLKYSNPTNIINEVTNTFVEKRSRLIADVRTGQLIVLTTEKEMVGTIALIDKLDVATRQVLIEAILAETTRNPQTLKGIDWASTLTAQNVTFGNGNTTGTSTTTSSSGSGGGSISTPDNHNLPFGGATGSSSNLTSLVTAIGGGGIGINTMRGFSPATAFMNADGIKAVLSFINSDSETESIALPRTVAQDGVQTELAVVRNIPVFEQQQGQITGASQNAPTITPNYEKTVNKTILNEVGVKLTVTPKVVGVTNVHLALKPEISVEEVEPATFTLDNKVNTAPIFNRRSITTETTVPSGYTLVLGGLNNDSTSKGYSKVPVLGDLPGLGLLFRHDKKTRTKSTLLIFVTPTIVEDGDFQRSKGEFLKTKYTPKPDEEESPWDGGKPADWTKPSPNVEPVYEPKAIK